jgi:hypothetical protein
MTTRILSKKEIQSIERKIDEINAHAELLDPSNPIESEQLYFYDQKLARYLETLELSYRIARIKESGLSIVR